MSESNEGGKSELKREQEHCDEQASSPERPRPSPRIYVASLADYNAGELLGAWIDAAQEPEALHAEIEAMLAQSNEEVAEDWAIHDYEEFGPFQLHEYETMGVVSAVAKGIAEHGPAYAAYVSWAGTDEEALGAFSDYYMGVGRAWMPTPGSWLTTSVGRPSCGSCPRTCSSTSASTTTAWPGWPRRR